MTIGEIAVEYLCGELCDDAISRQAVLKLFATHNGKYLFEAIRDLPSVTPKQRTAHWILDDSDNSITCDQCGCGIYANDIMNGDPHYCPKCGAKMESNND